MANTQDPLGAYRGKRDLTRTPEPSAGRKRRGRARPRFVVHQHDATTLHAKQLEATDPADPGRATAAGSPRPAARPCW
jgi:hypothetical protein